MPEYTDDTTDDSYNVEDPTDDQSEDSYNADLPRGVAEEAARLTRLARDAADREHVDGPFQPETGDSAASSIADADSTEDRSEAALYRTRRDELLDRFDYVARVRTEADGGGTLVCYPAEWLDESGTVRLDADLDTSRATEISLAGPGEQGDFEQAASENDELVEETEEVHGALHAANVRSFADFMSNHYARPARTASAAEVREFLQYYYPRNAWPSEDQADVVEESLRYAFELHDRPFPLD